MTQDPVGPGADASDPDSLFELYAAMPASFVFLFDRGGRVKRASHLASRLVSASAEAEILGTSAADLFGVDIADDLAAAFRHIEDSQNPVIQRVLWDGVQLLLTIQSFDKCRKGDAYLVNGGKHLGEILGGTDIPQTHDFLEARAIDLGVLAALTPRETEVVAVLARGSSMNEIGEQLGVSPKTVDNLLDRVAKRVGTRKRAELTRYAHAAGLTQSDASRLRLSQGARRLDLSLL